MKTFGQKATEALFALFDRAKLSGKPGALARETIAPDMADVIDELLKKHREARAKKKPAPVTEELGETLVAELEQTAAFAGVNVRSEYLLCQDWCRDHKRAFTRNRFKAWLRKEARDVLKKAPGGAKIVQFVQRSLGVQTEPFGWRQMLMRMHPSVDQAELARKQWGDVNPALRAEVVKEMAR